MTAAALGHDALLPRPPGGHGAGAVLSLLAHAGLLLALTAAVDWRTHTPDVVSAELWASVPQAAAPRAQPVPEPAPTPAPTPAPPPPAPAPPAPRVEPPAPAEPDIAVERERRRKAEADAKRVAEAEAEAKRTAQAEAARKAAETEAARKAEADKRKAEAEARQKAEADKRRAEAEKQRLEQEAQKKAQQAEDARLAKQREENLKRMMGQAGGPTANTGSGGTGTAAQSAAPSAAYAGRLVAEIRRHIFFDTGTVPDSAVPEVEVRTAPGGTILSRRLVKSSGHKEWDEAVLRAIDRITTLPRDVDGRVPPVILVAFRPRDS